MDRTLTADDILPLIASLTPEERVRLFRLLSIRPKADDTGRYRAMPPGGEEFSEQLLTDEDDPLSWEAEGWEDPAVPGKPRLPGPAARPRGRAGCPQEQGGAGA